MKYVPKLQGGGGFVTFTPYIAPSPTPGGGYQRNPATEEKSASSLLDEDTFKELLTKGGLVNDVNAFANQLISLENAAPAQFMQSNNRLSALKLVGKINELKQSKAL